MRSVILALICLASHIALGQQWPFEYWHEGKLVLEAGDTLKGQIKYDIHTDIIQFNQKNVLQSFHCSENCLLRNL